MCCQGETTYPLEETELELEGASKRELRIAVQDLFNNLYGMHVFQITFTYTQVCTTNHCVLNLNLIAFMGAVLAYPLIQIPFLPVRSHSSYSFETLQVHTIQGRLLYELMCHGIYAD